MVEAIGVCAGRIDVALPCVAVAACLHTAAGVDADGIAGREFDLWVRGGGLFDVWLRDAPDGLAGGVGEYRDDVELVGGLEQGGS